ncbi:hypothetical protein E1B28_011380 [Marasmius oreades]|uniref:Uncharacterized protein n=1 Tax=Marasmius oreades TaxID=181124 RepID=A0A9P7RUQ3_9AGAR|nr:uncharacterized protein E1B28_011380 [Marasmius oreades]KAG7089725.1 hypothetical protein E1B28_011380 [Marasmius oreades]
MATYKLHTSSSVYFLHTRSREAVGTSEATDSPSIPINWRLSESIGLTKGYQASILNASKIEPQKLVNTILNIIERKIFVTTESTKVAKSFPPAVHPLRSEDPYTPCTNIYKTKDNRFHRIRVKLDAHPFPNHHGIPRKYALRHGKINS